MALFPLIFVAHQLNIPSGLLRVRVIGPGVVFVSVMFSFPGCTPLVNLFTFFPDRTAVLSDDNLPEAVTRRFIPVNKRVRLECLYLPSAVSEKCCIYFHGNGGNIAQRLPDLMHLRKLDVAVVGVGYRGYGASTGRPSERGIYEDGETVYSWVRDTLGYRERDIFLFGRSLGSSVALTIAQNRHLAGIILVTPLSTGREYARAHGWGPLSFLSGNCFDNMGKAARLRSPALIIHGTHDEVIPYRLGKRLYDAVLADKKLVTIEKGYHNTLEYVDPALFWRSIGDFLHGGT